MENPTPTPSEQDAKIKALLAQMDVSERVEAGRSIEQQRRVWQKAWYLRYVIGPFLAGQLFDLWRWILVRVDDYLWGWAQDPNGQPPPITKTSSDPKETLRRALESKSKNSNPDKR